MSPSVGRLLRAALVASVIAASIAVPTSAALGPASLDRALSSDVQSVGRSRRARPLRRAPPPFRCRG